MGDETTIAFVDYLELGQHPHLIAHECDDCGAHFFDRRVACASCFGRDFHTIEVPREGRVTSFTIVHLAAPGIPVPFTSAIVDCGGITARGILVNVQNDPEHVTLSMPVRLTTVPVGVDAAGMEAVSYAFEPLEVASIDPGPRTEIA